MAIPLPRLNSWDDSLFETVVAAAINGVVAISEHGLIRVFNSACESMFQYRREEVLGHGLHMLLASPYREEYERDLARYRVTGETSVVGTGREITAKRKDGSQFPIFLSVGEGSHRGERMFVAIVQDLSELQEERAMHAEQRAFLAAIVDSANDAIVGKTLDGKVTSWNRAAEKLFGYTAAEMIGTPITRLFPEDRLGEEGEIIGRIMSGTPVEHYETVRLKKDGTAMDVSVTVSPIRDGAGRIVGASKTVRDITREKQNEDRLRALSNELNHVARLSEMGQVSAAIAHELNQPLTAVLNYTNLAKRLIATGAESGKAVDAVSKAGDQAVRAGHIIRRLRDFLEKRVSARSAEDINAITEDALALGLIGVKTAILCTKLDLAPGLPPVLADKIQIQQVLVNLLRNAAEAMDETPERILTLSTAATADGFVVVRVSDTGSGISGEAAKKLFRPFVTTKPGGMGIGLAISRSIIESHGGRLTMEPNPGGGTVFQFTLPSATRIAE